MDITYKNVVNNCITECAHDQIAVTCVVNAKERGGVKKLLGVSSECKVYTAEAMKGEAKITGKVCYKVVYSDKENNVCGLDYFCDFNESIVGEITPTDRIIVNHSVVDVSGRIEDDSITLTSVCDFVLRSIGTYEAKAVDCAESLYTDRQIFECVTLYPIKEDTFEASREEESGVAVDKVLYFSTTPIITNVTKSQAGAVVDGMIQTEIVFMTQDGIKGKSFGIDFSEEIDVENLADVVATVKNSRLVLSGDQSNNVFEVEVYVTLNGYDVGIKDEEFVVDAFSTSKELNVRREYLPCKRYTKSVTFDLAVSSDVEGDSLPNNATVLATPVQRVNVANVYAGDGEVTIEGVAVATILYSDETRVDSVQVELPFSVTEQVEGIVESDYLTAEAIITDFEAVFAAGIIKLNLMLKARVCVYTTYSLSWVSGIVVGEDKPQNVNGISIYYVGAKDSVWDIAKAVNLSPDEVVATNPNIMAEGEGEAEPRRVVVFRRK